MHILITGACGFVGHFLTQELLRKGHTVCGFDLKADASPQGLTALFTGSITDRNAVTDAVEQTTPQGCIHLAGIASPPVGIRHPELMLNTNILGTARVLDALYEKAPSCRFLLASTAYVYGPPPVDIPIHEDVPLRPNGIYAVSKAAADLMTLGYAQDHGLHTMAARAGNHTGPGQSTDFVVPAFVRQIADMARGKQPLSMQVGNLESERSFMDVRDVVYAYRLLIERGQAGIAYNVAAPGRFRIGKIIEILSTIANITPSISVDPQRYRATDRTPLLDTTLLTEATGWQPRYRLEDTLKEMFDAACA
ncbi:MAG TPA: hypothetical protein DCS43_08790 [Verrucomicrobia bacterium]|nr:hypothetical protein [Verrucomicrobiota bacterium]